MTETVSLLVVRYRTPGGSPTCAVDFTNGRVCRFYSTRSFGTREFCVLNPTQLLERRIQHLCERCGYLIPTDTCPLFEGEQQ